jgi:hypothetical protein
MDEMNIEAINLEAVDVDGAIREGAEGWPEILA